MRRSGLLLQFTERHPDVKAIDEQLVQLKKQRDADRAALASTNNGMEGVANATNPVYQSVQIALNEAGVAIAEFRGRVAQREATIKQLNEQINIIPRIEAEYAELTRDYAPAQLAVQRAAGPEGTGTDGQGPARRVQSSAST